MSALVLFSLFCSLAHRAQWIPCLPPSFADDHEAQAAPAGEVVCSLSRPDRGRAIPDARELSRCS
jgi:hypothetical protein